MGGLERVIPLLRASHIQPTMAVTAIVTTLSLSVGRGAGSAWVALAVLSGQLSVGWSNDYLDRDGSRTPIDFPAGLGLPKRIEAQVVQAATKWKRMALAQFECAEGQGINTDMGAVRKDYFLDHDHSSYVDQWDWEKRITAKDRNLDYLIDTVKKIWKVIRDAGNMVKERFPELNDPRFPEFPEELKFLHAEEILNMYPDLPRKERETLRLSPRECSPRSPDSKRNLSFDQHRGPGIHPRTTHGRHS